MRNQVTKTNRSMRVRFDANGLAYMKNFARFTLFWVSFPFVEVAKESVVTVIDEFEYQLRISRTDELLNYLRCTVTALFWFLMYDR